MSMLLLALALVTPAPTVANEGSWGDEVSCSVNVRALDSQGQARSARRVSATAAPVVVFRGKVSPNETDAPPLVFDVYSPRGQRYQVLLATPRVVPQGDPPPQPAQRLVEPIPRGRIIPRRLGDLGPGRVQVRSFLRQRARLSCYHRS